MKQDIVCLDCQRYYKPYHGGMDGPPEYVRKVHGTALNDFRCDFCNAEIPKHTLCVAVSCWTDAIHYLEWEYKFVERQELSYREGKHG